MTRSEMEDAFNYMNFWLDRVYKHSVHSKGFPTEKGTYAAVNASDADVCMNGSTENHGMQESSKSATTRRRWSRRKQAIEDSDLVEKSQL